jgi:hypothetical protein
MISLLSRIHGDYVDIEMDAGTGSKLLTNLTVKSLSPDTSIPRYSLVLL